MPEGAVPPSVTHVDARDGWEPDDETGGSVLLVRASDEVTIGLWKPDGVAGTRIEYRLDADETFVVLNGSGELRVDGDEPVLLRPGVVVSLSRGSEVSWLVDDDFRELWVYS